MGGRFLLHRALRQRGWEGEPIRGIIVTHGHLDHILNVSTIARETGAWIAAPRLDADHYSGHPHYRGWARVTGCLESVGRPVLSFPGIMYCKWLYNSTGIFYRLPTEAEWEYACRAGESTDPINLNEYAYFKDNSGSKFHKVAQLKPNAWGLYDMLGNVSEWTLDQYNAGAYQKLLDKTKNPTTPVASRHPRVTRGGSYLDDAKELRCANRIPSSADWNKRDPQIPKSRWWLTDGMGVGFRIVRPAQVPSKEEIEKFYAMYLK